MINFKTGIIACLLSTLLLTASTTLFAKVTDYYPIARKLDEKNKKLDQIVNNIKIIYETNDGNSSSILDLIGVLDYINNLYYKKGDAQKIHLFLNENMSKKSSLAGFDLQMMLYETIRYSKIPVTAYNLQHIGSSITLLAFCAASNRYHVPEASFNFIPHKIYPFNFPSVERELQQDAAWLQQEKSALQSIYYSCLGYDHDNGKKPDLLNGLKTHPSVEAFNEILSRRDKALLFLSPKQIQKLGLITKTLKHNTLPTQFDILIMINDKNPNDKS